MIDRKINLHYWPGMEGKKNFGDEMSSYIMKKLLPFNEFSYNINSLECEVNMIALGSYIQMAKDDYYIFGSGVRTERDRSGYKKLNIISVRGPKSRDFLISKGVDCPELYGDPGLFMSRYYNPSIDPSLKGKIGIVPHITDKTNYNKNNSDKFHIIDPCQHWTKVIDQICSCESIVSSSLHGLICADSYNIPNVWMEYKLLDEGDFKFIDYFLSQGREINKISSLEYINNDIFYRGGNNINLDELSAALYSSDLNKKNKKLAILFNIPISNAEKYNNWRDGFTEAIKLLSSIYKISLINVSDGIPNLSGFDWIFVKEGFSDDIFPAIKNKTGSTKLGIFVSASTSNPSKEQLEAFDLIFYETNWYAKNAGLLNQSKAHHAFGIDSSIMRPHLNQEKNIDCLFVGSIVAYKRPWEILKYPGRKVCVGFIEDNKIANFLRDRGVEIIDFISYENLAELYNKSNLCLIPCETHGGGERAVLEARSCGTEVKVLPDNEKLKELKGGKIFNQFDYSVKIFKAINNFRESVNMSLINPTAITRDNKQYTLYRGEKYSKGKPPPIGFNRSELSYWLECDGLKKQCVFDFGEYSYKTIKRIDIEKKSNKSIIEDLRFIESSIKQTKNGLTCLATCTLLPHVTIFDGTKNKNGEFDKSKPIGLAYTFKMAYCEVNLTNCIIKYKGMINPDSQIKNEKNWTSFIYNNNFFVIYSISPLVYSKASSLEEIKFKKTNLPDKLDFHCSTNPINIGGDKFAMLCHKRNQSKDFHYQYNLVTFNVLDGDIININHSNIDVSPKLYCSSIILDNNKIKVLAGKEDLENSSFYINIPAAPTFPNISSIKNKEIPRKIHLSWKDKDILNSNYQLIKKGAKNLEILNPEWDIQVYDDEDINRTLRDSIGLENWNLIKDKKITEKTDLWRLLKTFQEGGLYIDIDRYIDTPLSNIINQKTSMVLPTFQDIDFSQDFILTCSKNPIIGEAIANNLKYRSKGESLFFLAVQSYMHSVSKVISGKKIDRGNNPEYFKNIRNKINKCDFIETYLETGPGHHTLFRDIDKQFNLQTFEKDKADFYNEEQVTHWNVNTQKRHESIDLQSKKELDIKEYYKKLDQKFIFEGGENSIENKCQAKRLIELCNKYNCKNVMEIGFNAGHSADLFLSINENIKLTSFDIGVHKYVNFGKKFIDYKYPNRHSLILGDSKKTIPDFHKHNSSIKFDLIFIDGDHSEIGAISDLFNCKALSHNETIVVMDDTRNDQPMASWNVNVNKAWKKCISAGVLYQIQSEDYNQEDSCARGQSWGKYIFKEAKNTTFNLEPKQKEFIKLKDEWQNFKDHNFLKYVSTQLPKTEISKNKFNAYNTGQKIAIVSLYTKEIADYAVHSENSIREYCEKQNYTFYVYREKLEENSSPNWSKSQALLNHIDDHDYIVWMDSDTLIFNNKKKFEHIISKASRKFIFATKDIGDNSMLNSGVLIFKNHDYVKRLIKKWRDFSGDKTSLYSSGGDQEILCDILKKSDGFGFNRKIFEMNEFNTDPRLINKDTFILHFMAYPYELKKIFMSYWQNNFLIESL